MRRNKILQIRAHHLLCIQGFQGYGYDEPFTYNLKKIHSIFFNQKKIRLIISNDVICQKCPFSSRNNEYCLKKGFNARNFDLKILKILGIKPEKTVKLNQLLFYSNQDRKKTLKLKKLCRDCEWNSKCLWFLS